MRYSFPTLLQNIRLVQGNQAGLKENGAHQLLAYTDGVNILGDNTVLKKQETSIDENNELSLEINVEKTKHMELSRHNNAGKNRHIEIANRQYLARTVTNQNLILEENLEETEFG
jgi:hypothetical protein